jgi:hypothetical protein
MVSGKVCSPRAHSQSIGSGSVCRCFRKGVTKTYLTNHKFALGESRAPLPLVRADVRNPGLWKSRQHPGGSAETLFLASTALTPQRFAPTPAWAGTVPPARFVPCWRTQPPGSEFGHTKTTP